MKTCFFLIILFLSSQIQFAQQKQNANSGENEVFTIPEVGALIVRFNNTFKVQFVAPENVRLTAYKNVDLRKDDILLSVNGQPIKKIGDIEEAYNKLKIGQVFKLDIKRNKQNLVVNIQKADPKSLPPKKSFSSFGQHSDNKVVVTGLGLLIINVNEKPMINKLFHKDDYQIKKADLGEGDLLTEMNNQQIKSFGQFKSAWESINPGQEVTLRFNKTKSVSFKKQ